MKPLLPALFALLAATPLPSATAAPVDDAARMRELEAEIARRTQAYEQQHKLRRKRIGGDVADKRFEKYLASFRRKIACSSLQNFPAAARGKTYGDMIVTVSIRADGSFEKATVDRGSGFKVLDDGAIEIARRAAPYEPFPPYLKVDTDVLDITRTWTFTSQETEEGAVDDPCA
ncbi:MAG: energy transducer TonB [Azoarcus sp.]|nr:energy transducer TonB [Azoarcus sp.]